MYTSTKYNHPAHNSSPTKHKTLLGHAHLRKKAACMRVCAVFFDRNLVRCPCHEAIRYFFKNKNSGFPSESMIQSDRKL